MKKNIGVARKVDIISIVFISSILIIYFLLPKSLVFQVNGDFRLFPLYLQPWYLQRYLLIAVCLGYTCLIFCLGRVALTKLNVTYLIFTTLFLYFPFTQGNFVVLYAVVGVFSSYCLIYQVYKKRLPKALLWLSLACAFSYVCQYFLFKVSTRITSSFLDPNIAGYYLFLCFVIFRSANHKLLSLVAFMCGALSLSRNFYLAVFVFEILNIPSVQHFFKYKLRFKSPEAVSLLSLILIIAISIVFVNIANPNETIGSSSERLLNIHDGSNYSRAKANLEMLGRLAEGDFWLNGQGNEMDGLTEHRPHNAFLRAIYRYGFALSMLAFVGFFFVMKFNVIFNYAFFISIFSYYTLLNDFITGPDLTLMLCVGIICSEFKLRNGNDTR